MSKYFDDAMKGYDFIEKMYEDNFLDIDELNMYRDNLVMDLMEKGCILNCFERLEELDDVDKITTEDILKVKDAMNTLAFERNPALFMKDNGESKFVEVREDLLNKCRDIVYDFVKYVLDGGTVNVTDKVKDHTESTEIDKLTGRSVVSKMVSPEWVEYISK